MINKRNYQTKNNKKEIRNDLKKISTIKNLQNRVSYVFNNNY